MEPTGELDALVQSLRFSLTVERFSNKNSTNLVNMPSFRLSNLKNRSGAFGMQKALSEPCSARYARITRNGLQVQSFQFNHTGIKSITSNSVTDKFNHNKFKALLTSGELGGGLVSACGGQLKENALMVGRWLELTADAENG